jgi:hypothetical protein
MRVTRGRNVVARSLLYVGPEAEDDLRVGCNTGFTTMHRRTTMHRSAETSKMPIANTATRARRAVRATVNAERRTRARLRELCDEVLASYRVAQGRDLWTDEERHEARSVLARVAPLGR